jgi:hypothetical protein
LEPQPVPEQAFPQVVWLAPEQNPFGVRVLDCRGFSNEMIALSGDPGVAESFLALRRSTGANHRGTSPPNPQRIAFPLTYPLSDEFAKVCDVDDGPVFLAETMEDKWDIYLHDGWFYFARSWTGNLVFRAGVIFTEDQMEVCPMEMEGSYSDDPEFGLRVVDFIIKSHLLAMQVPHPLPPGFPDDATRIAAYSFSHYGRRAAYATYADTLPSGIYRRFDPDATRPL